MKTTRRDFITATGAVIACAALPTTATADPFDPQYEDNADTVTCYKQMPQGERIIKFEDMRKGDLIRFSNQGLSSMWTVTDTPHKQLIGKGPSWTWGCVAIPDTV